MHPELKAHPAYFKKAIVQLAENVYQAYGFAASNVYMLIGDGGVVIVDTTETTAAAKNIMAEFRKITDLPVKTILYTHSHRDHVSGAAVFAEGGTPEILAATGYSDDPLGVASSHPRPKRAMQMRTKRQFGIGLEYPEQIIGIGIGPGDRPLEGMGAGNLPPTRRIGREGETITPCGMELQLVMAPGETPDHMVIWYGEKKILFCGDNYYRAFPNLYAIRGTEYRDFDIWADSVDLLIGFGAETLAPGHTKALHGREHIAGVLGEYRDAIRHVINETREGMDAGLTMDALAHRVRLPEHLAEKPHLREFYGRVDWSVRAYFTGVMGWFDGNPTSLATLAPEDEARRFIELAGGDAAVMAAAEQAHKAGEFQWALQLLDRLIFADMQKDAALRRKSAVLRDYAEGQINCPARHYYLLTAAEMDEASAKKD